MGEGLTESVVLSALHQTVQAHPGLAAVAVIQPAKKKGRHNLERVMLHSIDLRSCVEFIDGDNVAANAELFEKVHNQWLFMDNKPNRPWWKVLVLDRREIVFVFHHFVCDGKAGYEFQRTFLEALNSTKAAAISDAIVRFNPNKNPMPPNPMEFSPIKLSIMRAIFGVLYWMLIRLFYGGQLFFSDFKPPKPYPPITTGCADISQRTVTRIAGYRISAAKMVAISDACRRNNTTFSPLLTIAATATLASKFYPMAKLGFAHNALDIRSLLRYPEGNNGDRIIWNAAGGALEMIPLTKVHDALKPLAFTSNGKPETAATADKTRELWKLVRDYKRSLEKEFTGSHPPAIQLWLSGNMLGPYLEDMVEKAFPSLGLQQQNSIAFSNLGRFPTPKRPSGSLADTLVDAWKIEEVQFSTCITGGSVSNHGLRMNIAGIGGGDTIVNIAWEDEFASRAMVNDFWQSTMKLIDVMLQSCNNK